MTAKEKAKELVDSFYQTTPNEAWYNPPLGSISIEYKAWGQAKECALKAVDEMINCLNDDDLYIQGESNIDGFINFYKEVKKEIEKL